MTLLCFGTHLHKNTRLEGPVDYSESLACVCQQMGFTSHRNISYCAYLSYLAFISFSSPLLYIIHQKFFLKRYYLVTDRCFPNTRPLAAVFTSDRPGCGGMVELDWEHLLFALGVCKENKARVSERQRTFSGLAEW